MRHAVSIPPFADPRALVDMAILADERGWDAVLFWDHMQWNAALELDVFDPWSLLSATAARTERIRLGTCVTPLARRRPHVVAKQLITLDHLSGGRALLGVGLGEPADADFAALGDTADQIERAAMLDEGLSVIDGIARGEHLEHDGQYFRVHARLRPAAVQRPRPPIFVAGVAPHRAPLRRAVRWDGYFPIGTDDLLSPQQIADHLGDLERPPGWELFAARAEGYEPAAFAGVGVTWLVEGAWPVGDWVPDLVRRIDAGPPR